MKLAQHFFMAAQLLIAAWMTPVALAVPYAQDQGSSLNTFQLNDAFEAQAPMKGHLLFLYRELATCSPEQTCRRLALAWLAPDGRAIELNADENALSTLVRRASAGSSTLGPDVTVKIPVSTVLFAQLGKEVEITTSPHPGHELTISMNRQTQSGWTRFPLARFKRVSSLESPVATLSELRARLKKPRVYHAQTRPKLEEREYTVFINPEVNGFADGVVASIPIHDRKDENWSLAKFAVANWMSPTAEPDFVLKNVGRQYIPNKNLMVLSRIEFVKGDHVDWDPGALVLTTPHLNGLWLSTSSPATLLGIGQIRMANPKEILNVETWMTGVSWNLNFAAAKDNRLAEFVVRKLAETVQDFAVRATGRDPFLDILANPTSKSPDYCDRILSTANPLAATKLNLTNAQAPQYGSSGHFPSHSPGGGSRRTPWIRD